MHPALLATAEAVAASLLPGGRPPGGADLEIVRRGTERLLAIEDPERRSRPVAAVVIAHARAEEVGEAIRIAEIELARQDDLAPPTDAARARVAVAAAEAHLVEGRTRRGTVLARRAAAYAERAADDGLRAAAASLVALAAALNGEYAAARVALTRVDGLERLHGWGPGPRRYAAELATILVAAARLDGAALDAVADSLEAGGGDQPFWTGTAKGARAMALLTRNDPERALPLLHEVLSGTGSEEVLPMVRGFCLGIRADLLLAGGEARRALTLLEEVPSPPEHALCFAMQRASAHLLLDDPRAALRVTDDCLRMGPVHCLRTVAPVLLRRALASAALGDDRGADAAFAEAFHLIAVSGASAPLLTLPAAGLERLLQRQETRGGVDTAEAASFRSRLAGAPPVDTTRSSLPPLTARERVLAGSLRDGASLPAIAAALHVSPNTVKSQVRTLYRKLGVTSRDAALARLERAGLFD